MQPALFLSQMKHAGLQRRELLAIYKCFIRPVLEYARPFWFSSLPEYLLKDTESAQKSTATNIWPQPYDDLLRMPGLPTLHERLRTPYYSFYTVMKSPNHRLRGLLPSTGERRGVQPSPGPQPAVSGLQNRTFQTVLYHGQWRSLTD